jgi:hypothetical protein
VRFARERTDADRFARALEPSPVRRDGEFADELVVVGALRELGASGAPDLETRQRIRAEIAGRLETAAATPVRRWRPRTADLVAAALFLFLLLSGLTLVLSRNALPGGPLYAVKRAGETTSLSLTFGDQEKAQKHLEFATNRVTELGELAAEGASEADYRTAYDDFAGDLRAGVTQLTAAATSDGSGAQQLSDVRLWARNQAARLAAQQTELPAGAIAVFGDAQNLLGKVQERTSGLVARLSCYQITTGTADDLGLLPATGECTQRPVPSSGGEPSSAPTSPTSAAETTAPVATGTQLPPSDATATAGTPAPTGGLTPPPVFGQPPSTPRPPTTSTSRPPPLVSIPPLLPGLPPIIIG